MSEELRVWSAPDGWRPEPCQHSGERPYPCATCSAGQKQERLELVTRERDTLLDLLRQMAAADPHVAETFRVMSDKAEWYLLDDVLPD